MRRCMATVALAMMAGCATVAAPVAYRQLPLVTIEQAAAKSTAPTEAQAWLEAVEHDLPSPDAPDQDDPGMLAPAEPATDCTGW